MFKPALRYLDLRGASQAVLFVDKDVNTIEEIHNGDLHHVHGMCRPLKALCERQVDAIAVGGLGDGGFDETAVPGCQSIPCDTGYCRTNYSGQNIIKGAAQSVRFLTQDIEGAGYFSQLIADALSIQINLERSIRVAQAFEKGVIYRNLKG
jgi:hypothetical protein